MGQVIKFFAFIFLATMFIVLIYYISRGWASWRQGYSWEEMDWRQRGYTSIADFFAASDIGKRDVIINGKQCNEYFSYKDGLPIKIVCSEFTVSSEGIGVR